MPPVPMPVSPDPILAGVLYPGLPGPMVSRDPGGVPSGAETAQSTGLTPEAPMTHDDERAMEMLTGLLVVLMLAALALGVVWLW